MILDVIFWSLVGGLLSLIGGVALLTSKKRTHQLSRWAIPFAAGSLLATAFVDLLHEAAEAGQAELAINFALVGIVAFFLLEKVLSSVHHHHGEASEDHQHQKSKISLIVAGDTLHNFIDGLAIGAAFLAGAPTGIVTALIIATHEIPQEVGDFGLLISRGLSKKKVLWINAISALASTFGAVIFYLFGSKLNISEGLVLGLAAGFFIYIAVSDLIPTIQKKEPGKVFGINTILMLLGVITVTILTKTLHGLL
jgi:zinc and cadmium transporter